MQSTDSLRELNAKLLAEIAKLRKENAEIPELREKLLRFSEVEAENAKLRQIIEENARRDSENAELKSRVGELEARLAILEQGVTEVNWQPQNDKEVIAEVSAVDISDSVIDQQNDVNTKSIEDKEIGDFIPEEPANVSDSVIAQPKQC